MRFALQTNFDSEVVNASMFIGPGDIYIGFLPLSHILELVLQLICVYKGVAIGYASPRTLMPNFMKDSKGDLQELQPTIIPGVPTIWQKVIKKSKVQIKKG